MPHRLDLRLHEFDVLCADVTYKIPVGSHILALCLRALHLLADLGTCCGWRRSSRVQGLQSGELQRCQLLVEGPQDPTWLATEPRDTLLLHVRPAISM